MKRSNSQTQVAVVGAARTPIGKHGGCFNDLSAEDLAVLAIKEALERAKIRRKPVKIGQVVAGMIYADASSQNIYLPRNAATRAAALLGDANGLDAAPGKTTLRICGTGFQTLADAYDLITAEGPNKMDCVLSFGTESMSQTHLVHHGRRRKDNVWEFSEAPLKDFLLEGFQHYRFRTLMPKTADTYGKLAGITREDCDAFAVLSHERAKKAQLAQWNRRTPPEKQGTLSGSFAVDTVDGAGRALHVWRDEGARYDADLPEMASLPPILGPGGLVTAGNASQISDGAAAAVLMDRRVADTLHIPYIAVLRGYHFSTVDPTIMGRGPVPAVTELLAKLKLKKKDVDLWEVNEAFAAQYLAVEKELGLPRELTNVNGGAVAIGHNIAATGLRITTDLIHELRRRGLRRGVASACIGGGQGGAVAVEIV